MSDDLQARIGTILIGLASGLLPLAIFTPFYAIWPVFAWPVVGFAFFVVAVAWSIYLGAHAVHLFRLGRRLPHEATADDERISKAMGITGGVQGGVIITSAIVLALLGLWPWILPTVVLVVALHFLVMPWIFHRSVDYYLGAAMLAVSAVGFILTAQGQESWQVTWGVVGIGATLVTSTYGLLLRRTVGGILAEYRHQAAI